MITIADVRAVVQSPLTDTQLQAVIDRETSIATSRYGPVSDGTNPITETTSGMAQSVYLRHPIVEVVEVVEQAYPSAPVVTLDGDDYTVIAREARLVRHRNRWSGQVTVTYIGEDTRPTWRAVLIELVRIGLEQTAMEREEVANEYRYQAPEWEHRRNALYRRLGFASL